MYLGLTHHVLETRFLRRYLVAKHYTGGLCGPVELGTLLSTVAQILAASQPGQLCQPIRLGEWLVILRLEKLISAKLNEVMCQRLLNELFEVWLQEEIRKFN